MGFIQQILSLIRNRAEKVIHVFVILVYNRFLRATYRLAWFSYESASRYVRSHFGHLNLKVVTGNRAHWRNATLTKQWGETLAGLEMCVPSVNTDPVSVPEL